MGYQTEMKNPAAELIRPGVEYYDKEISDCALWEPFYHLSSLRRAALCWYPFADGCRILEVGCGLGALTGLLCEKAACVDAVDRDAACIRLTGKRYANRKNLRLHHADIRSYTPELKYDYIVVMEILESDGGDAAGILAHLRTLLMPDGVLLLGFRNRNALKYQCGAVDEYVKRPGDAMKPGTPLFAKRQMEEILRAAGYWELRWYYPLPDFGFTQAVYSDEWLPERTFRDRVLPYDPFGAGDAACALTEYARYDGMIADGLFPEQANVCLAACRISPEGGDRGHVSGTMRPTEEDRAHVIGALLSSDRERAHAFAIVIYDSGTVCRRALFPEGADTLRAMQKNIRALAGRGIGTVPHALSARAEEEGVPELKTPYIREPLLREHIRTILRAGADKEAAVSAVRTEVSGLFARLYEDICRSSEHVGVCDPRLDAGAGGPVLAAACIDMTPDNAFWDGAGIRYFDQEFLLENCPADYVLYRAIRYTWLHISEAQSVFPLEEIKEEFGLTEKWAQYTQFEDSFTWRNRNRQLYAAVYRWAWQKKPYRTGLIMGAFDLFHTGHLNLIRRAKERCSYLRVGVLCDDLIRLYKKHDPQVPCEERRRVVEAIRYVDEAFTVDGPYVSKVQEWYRHPYDCYFSGDDYAENAFWKQEARELEKLGARIEFFPYTEGISSTMLRERRDGSR